MIKLYGFSKIMSFPCICWGSNGYFFYIKWIKKKFRVYKGHTTAEDIVFNNRNTYPKWWFIGIMINDSAKGSLDYTTYS